MQTASGTSHEHAQHPTRHYMTSHTSWRLWKSCSQLPVVSAAARRSCHVAQCDDLGKHRMQLPQVNKRAPQIQLHACRHRSPIPHNSITKQQVLKPSAVSGGTGSTGWPDVVWSAARTPQPLAVDTTATCPCSAGLVPPTMEKFRGPLLPASPDKGT